MKDTCYLVLDRRGARRMAKRPPDLYAGEIAVRIVVTAEDKHFRSLYVDAAIQLDERHLIHPEADVEVVG